MTGPGERTAIPLMLAHRNPETKRTGCQEGQER